MPFNIDAQRAQELARDLSTPQGRYEVGQTISSKRELVLLHREV